MRVAGKPSLGKKYLFDAPPEDARNCECERQARIISSILYGIHSLARHLEKLAELLL
jgi:hypothetical protein